MGVRGGAVRKNLASTVIAGGGTAAAAAAAMAGCGYCRPSSLDKRYLLASYFGLQSYARREQEVLNAMVDSREDQTSQL